MKSVYLTLHVDDKQFGRFVTENEFFSIFGVVENVVNGSLDRLPSC